VRFGERLSVAVDAGNAGDCLVPPLLLQPLVENAVTHGVAHLIDGGQVQVTASRDAAWLRIVVDNPCDPDRPKGAGTGVGLANVAARLRALHGADATVLAGERDQRWQVQVTLPVTVGETA
jgi:LytS/YehU family sensor histidine kinase